jgi:hypothetical protein
MIPIREQTTPDIKPPKPSLTERQSRLREFWVKSDRALEDGMPALSLQGINEEVSRLRGTDRGEA